MIVRYVSYKWNKLRSKKTWFDKESINQTSEEEVYLAVIEDSKSWIKWSKDTISPHSPDSVVQTISKFEEAIRETHPGRSTTRWGKGATLR